MIHFAIPWDSNKNIAESYKYHIDNSSKDWVCFIDGDAVFTSSYFGKRLEECIRSNPEYSMFTCMTNRIGNSSQRSEYVDIASNNYHYHRMIGENHWSINHTECEDITSGIPASGVMLLCKKEDLIGEGLDKKGMLGIDNLIHMKLSSKGSRIGLLKGIYLYHYYSNWDGNSSRDIDHLTR